MAGERDATPNTNGGQRPYYGTPDQLALTFAGIGVMASEIPARMLDDPMVRDAAGDAAEKILQRLASTARLEPVEDN